MIEVLDMEAAGVIGARISGKIDKPDIERVIAAAKAKFDATEKLGVYVEVKSFDGISFEALLEDLKFAFPNLGKFEKEAFVSDKKWIETIAVVSNRLFPNIEIRHFSFDQTAEARKWVAPMETDHP